MISLAYCSSCYLFYAQRGVEPELAVGNPAIPIPVHRPNHLLYLLVRHLNTNNRKFYISSTRKNFRDVTDKSRSKSLGTL